MLAQLSTFLLFAKFLQLPIYLSSYRWNFFHRCLFCESHRASVCALKKRGRHSKPARRKLNTSVEFAWIRYSTRVQAWHLVLQITFIGKLLGSCLYLLPTAGWACRQKYRAIAAEAWRSAKPEILIILIFWRKQNLPILVVCPSRECVCIKKNLCA